MTSTAFVGTILQLLGLLFEIGGVFLMVNLYVRRLPKPERLPAILSALVRGEAAKDAAQIAEIWPENKLIALQGLVLIGLGFVIQAVGIIVTTLD